MKEIEAHDLEDGEIFLQYYTATDHKDIFVGKYVSDGRYQWISCDVIWHYRCKEEKRGEWSVYADHEYFGEEYPRVTLANRSTYFGEVCIFRLTDDEVASILIEKI